MLQCYVFPLDAFVKVNRSSEIACRWNQGASVLHDPANFQLHSSTPCTNSRESNLNANATVKSSPHESVRSIFFLKTNICFRKNIMVSMLKLEQNIRTVEKLYEVCSEPSAMQHVVAAITSSVDVKFKSRHFSKK